MKKMLLTVLSLITLEVSAQPALKLFDRTTMSYKGTKTEQAQLLLRKVKIQGEIDDKKPDIDSPFLSLINKDMGIKKEKLRAYLTKHSINENTVGGGIDNNISYVMLNDKKVYAKYFVIHDISSPEFQNSFPNNIDDVSWEKNNVNAWTWAKGKEPSHMIVTRTGQSKTIYDFSEPWRATKFENNPDNYEYGLGKIAKGLFLHTELVQPRVYPPGKKNSAAKAPTPGFTEKQYEKLALLFVCASVRKEEWLIPAFHGCIDEHMKVLDKAKTKWIEDNHDDPQNFELKKFTDQVLKIVSNINAG